MEVDLSCPDWERRIVAGGSLLPRLPLFRPEADRAVAIFNRLRLPDVPNRPPFSEAGGDWFRDIVGALFGSVDPVTSERFLRELFLLVPKKNAKTTNGAALMLTALLMNRRPRAEFLFLGPTQEVANLAMGQALGMIEADPEGFLQKRMHVREHTKEIIDRRTKAVLRIKSFDPSVLTGVKPVGALVDELHVIAEMAKADRVIGQIRGGLLPNPEGFLVFITTQSETAPSGVFRAELMKARAIRDGRLRSVPMLPVMYEFPQAIASDRDRWSDPANWPMVLPNNGKSISVARLLPDFDGAVASGEEELRRWASQHLNIEIGLGLHSDRWAGADFWQSAAEPGLTLDALIDRCDVAVVGIDGGGLDDLLGLGVMGRERGTRRWLLWSHAWAHRIVLERRKEIAPRLLDFEKAGDLTVIDDDSDADVQGVADIIERIRDAGILAAEHAIGVDPVGINDIVDELERREFSLTTDEAVGQITAVKQGWTLSNAIKVAERRLAAKTMLHAGAAMMAWCVGNLKIEARGNAITATKQSAGSAKIDPAMAMFNAVNLMALNPEGAGASVFDRLGAAEAAQRAANPAPTADEEAAILRDPRHPRWQEMLNRYNRRLELADTDAEY